MFTTAGFTAFAISTKLCPASPGKRGWGAVVTGLARGTEGASGTAWPLGSHPRSDATTNPIAMPAVNNVAARIQLRLPGPGFLWKSGFILPFPLHGPI